MTVLIFPQLISALAPHYEDNEPMAATISHGAFDQKLSALFGEGPLVDSAEGTRLPPSQTVSIILSEHFGSELRS